jgi:hypothetical protein
MFFFPCLNVTRFTFYTISDLFNDSPLHTASTLQHVLAIILGHHQIVLTQSISTLCYSTFTVHVLQLGEGHVVHNVDF